VVDAPVSDLSGIRVVPAYAASWDDLQAVLGPARCHGGPCCCQRFKIAPAQWRAVDADERAERLRHQTNCDEPGAESTCGLVAYQGDVPVGWCRVEPRSAYAWLGQTPWNGRNEDPTDDTVWAVSCFILRKEHRRRGITHVLTREAVEFARDHGARAVEGYPMEVVPGQTITWGELHVGGVDAFLDAGFSVVGRPSKRRVVVRLDLL
jgi:GNAT superfamily N-acetyltransferase